MSPPRRLCLSCLAAWAAVGCTGIATGPTSFDAGLGRDAGGPSPDAGVAVDAGNAGTDAGNPAMDAGYLSPDAGGSDAGTPWDGGDDFPASSIIYADISDAGLDPNSQAIINGLVAAGGWGNGNVFQLDFSMVINHAAPNVTPQAFTANPGYYTPDCDMTTVPVPSGGAIEGSTNYDCGGGGDCHLLIYQGTRLYELYHADMSTGVLTSDCEVVWDLTHDYWTPGTSPYSRGDQCTSTDAAGMPVAALLVTGAELQAGAVHHAMRLILPNSHMLAGDYVHPATHAGGPSGASPLPSYGARFRLRANFDVSGLTPGARAIANALKKYGMFVVDGGNIAMTVDTTALSYVAPSDLNSLQVTDFEIVAPPDPAIALTDNCQRTPVTH